ncbi:GTP-binding protein [Chitinispirillales bacterium ANBcel5]|uniref:GTP-binding protein n=1 Tax=Cellulosispirillum alkaliphilum TaxID=3039283 RepID=UPI002A5503D1|nr:GTP-binding protein [Chitinispirillales bacterium ANBcel5]
MNTREQMNIVVVGHVDHGKSTVIGRLLADTNSLPKGKLDQVKATCERNARPFEYAFLLDALKDEQAQGITIDTARCFFKTKKRDYIIIDAPGHVEFLKNMVSGAARAEAALLVIDAHEGIKENSKRHGYLISMLGIKQLVVLVNKMDLVDHSEDVYWKIVKEYSRFLEQLGVKPIAFVPVSARDGDNIASVSSKAPWYNELTVLEHIDSFRKQEETIEKPFRMPVQDVYKFTESGDDRRIVAGAIETGKVSVGDSVVFRPSGKKSSVVSIEEFNVPKKTEISYGYAAGFTLSDELYLPRGEVMCRDNEKQPFVGTRFKANIFWMGRNPMVLNRKYKLKVASARVNVRLVEVLSGIDATDLSSIKGKQQIDRHDVAECVFETTRPIAFDLINDIESLGRFVIVDNYDIAGGGIITSALEDNESALKDHVRRREIHWDKGLVTEQDRTKLFGHKSKFVVITGSEMAGPVAKLLERRLVDSRRAAYYLGPSSLVDGLDSDVNEEHEQREEQIRRLGELARILTDVGTIFITALPDADFYDLEVMAKLTAPHEFLHVPLKEEDTVAEKSTRESQVTDSILNKLIKQEIIEDYVI